MTSSQAARQHAVNVPIAGSNPASSATLFARSDDLPTLARQDLPRKSQQASIQKERVWDKPLMSVAT